MKICIANDEAFNFIYKANIDALSRHGDIVFFSPLHDKKLPECEFLYLPGGYPELFARELSENKEMIRSIRDFAHQGGRILAECGGFMFLCKEIDGTSLCGVFPFDATMEGAYLHLGYRQMMWNGILIKGHEFHYSSLRPYQLTEGIRELKIQSTASGKPVDTPIYIYKNVIAGYSHWYWGMGIENVGLFDNLFYE